MTEETKEKISATKKGCKATPASFGKGCVPWNKGRKGIPWTETRRLAQAKVVKVDKAKRKLWKCTVGGKEYPLGWVETRKEIYERDNWTCQECGKKCHGNNNHDKIQCHHIDYNKNNCSPENLITLCVSCHCKTNFKKKDWVNYFTQKISSK